MSGAHDRGPRLRAESVTRRLGRRAVLDGVGLEVAAGEVVALVGPNGAGKSTLLGLLAGDDAPDVGRVLLDGADLAGLRPGVLARRRAVVLQEPRVSFPFLVREVVAMGRAPWRGTPQADRDEREVAAAMLAADVAPLADRRYPTLSVGERARVSFARALAQGTDVLLLDEPTAALDVHHQEVVLARVRERADAGVAVVVVLHDLSAAAAWADRVVVVHDGAVRADGPPHEVLTSGLLSDVYRHPVRVERRDDDLLVLPVRGARTAPRADDGAVGSAPGHPRPVPAVPVPQEPRA